VNQPFSILTVVLALLAAPAVLFAADSERTVKAVKFAKGNSAATLKGRITGYNYVDYQLRAGAGQKIQASLKASNGANYLNLLPPGSVDAAMYVGQTGDNRFEGLLPDDGVYTLRVYLMRSEARRKHSSDYTLTVSVTGKALPALSPRVDAVVPGGRFHATTRVRCEPRYTKVRECEAGVVRRGRDGTATVELAWDQAGKRRILFVKGKPEAADVPQPMTFTRDERGWKVSFGGDEHFEVPEALVFGG
jgi:hypothetical protein